MEKTTATSEKGAVALSTNYLGLDLKHPLVASAGPLSKNLDGIRSLEDAGASAVVLFSLFEEQIRYEIDSYDFLSSISSNGSFEAVQYFPSFQDFNLGPDEYLELIRTASKATEIPIIGSLNGITNAGWVEYAKLMQQAGAKAIELNIYFIPSDLNMSGREVEGRYEEITAAVAGSVTVPVAVKLSPFFSSIGEMCVRLVEAGASGLVLFNRFYQPDFDLEKMDVTPRLQLSTPSEMRLPLLWIGALSGRIECSFAASTGVHSGVDAVKYLLAGADAVMTTSSLLKNGPKHMSVLVAQLTEWLEVRGYESVAQMKGSMSHGKVSNPDEYERANYLRELQSYQPSHGL